MSELGREREQPDHPSCSQSPHDERGGMTPVLIPCSRSAHDQNVLARRPQWDQHGCHSQESETSKLGRVIERDDGRSMRACAD